MSVHRFAILTAVVAAATIPLGAARAEAQESQPEDKSGYTLFHPTPPRLMRDLDADRPDVSESPHTVDAGHVQVESSLAEFTSSRRGQARTRFLSVAPSNVKLGLFNNTDLEFLFQPYVQQEVRAAGQTQRIAGFGDDTELRAKFNLWGNDGGGSAFALLPFLKFPTGPAGLTNRHLEGGLALPLAVELPGGFELAPMAEFDVNRNQRNTRYGVDFVHSVSLAHAIRGPLSGYVEYAGVAPIRTGGGYQPRAGCGVIYQLGKNVQWDMGLRTGLNHNTDDILLFTGITIRF